MKGFKSPSKQGGLTTPTPKFDKQEIVRRMSLDPGTYKQMKDTGKKYKHTGIGVPKLEPVKTFKKKPPTAFQTFRNRFL